MNTTKASDTGKTDKRKHILAVGQSLMAKKGFSAVGLNEILTTASVPKGSFYYYFTSKDAFGEELLKSYFQDYLSAMDVTLAQPGLTMAQRLMNYWQQWQESQSFYDCQGKCLAVKLGAEVADLSEPMRQALNDGTSGIISRIARAIETGIKEGSMAVNDAPLIAAQGLYQLWLGSSVMVKILRNTQPFDAAMTMTQQIIHQPQ